MMKEERLHATTWSGAAPTLDDVEHNIDKDLVNKSDNELKV